MLDEAVEVFEAMLERKSEKWLYDNYIPTAGTYILLNLESDFSVRTIFDIGKPDKKTGEIPGKENRDYRLVSFLDKNSRLITMNKAMDTGKIIHSNNFYSFFVKKESLKTNKLDERIEGYYSILANPSIKYKKKKAKQIYEEVESKLGAVAVETVDKIKKWVQCRLNDFLNENAGDIDLEAKNYLKIFFVYNDDEKTKEEVRREGERYLLPNIYNNNDYNIKVNNEILGLHSNNMGLNDKKPFLDNKSRKEAIPCAISMERAVKQYQFMDYLSSQAAKGKYNVYIDLDRKDIACIKDNDIPKDIDSGLYFRIRQGKTEVEIYSFERITGYNSGLKRNFYMKEIFKLSDKAKEGYSDFYGMKYKLYQIEALVNEVLFSKWLTGNYKTSAGELPSSMDNVVKEQLLLCRDQLWKWFHNNESQYVGNVLEKSCKRLVINSIENEHSEKAKHQFNLWISLMDYLNEDRRKEEHMNDIRDELKKHILEADREWRFESDDEYYYAVGQISRYILELSKTSKKVFDMLRPIISVKNDKVLKERLVWIAKKYDYAWEMKYIRANELLSKILRYVPKEKVNEVLIISGYLDNNILKMSKKKSDEDATATENNGVEL